MMKLLIISRVTGFAVIIKFETSMNESVNVSVNGIVNGSGYVHII